LCRVFGFPFLELMW